MTNPFREPSTVTGMEAVTPEEQERRSAYIRKQTEQFMRLKEQGTDIAHLMRLLGSGAEKYLEAVVRGDQVIGRRFRFKDFLEEEAAHKERVALPDTLDVDTQVFIPPDEGEIPEGTGEGSYRHEIIPRTRFLMELLDELGLSYSVHIGKAAPDAIRKTPYEAFLIPEKRMIAFVNNEKNNVTFVIHDEDDHRPYSVLTKSELKGLGEERVSVLAFRDADLWKARMRDVLEGKRKSKPPTHPEGAYEVAPPGWETAGHLREILVNNDIWIEAQLVGMRSEHPGWFHTYYARSRSARKVHSKTAEHVAPEVVDALHSLLEKELAPEGWQTVSQVMEMTGLSNMVVGRRVLGDEDYRKFRIEHNVPGEPMFGIPQMHVSPKGIRALEERFGRKEDRPQAPEGWKTFAIASAEIGLDRIVLKDWCERLGKGDESAIRKYWSPASSKIVDFLSPELFALAKERWKKEAS